MKRRAAVAAGLAVLAAPRLALSQRKPALIGVLLTGSQTSHSAMIAAFQRGMRELSLVEGKDYVLAMRFAEGDPKRLAPLAAELVALKPDLIFAPSTETARPVHQLTREIPIVIATAADPIAAAFAQSLAHPGGNVTGLTALGSELVAKRLQLLRELLPGMQRVGTLYNPDAGIDLILLKQFVTGAKELGLLSLQAAVRGSGDVAPAMTELERAKAQALTVSATIVNFSLRASIVKAANARRIAGMYGATEFVEAGGLVSYAPNYADHYRRAAAYVDRILKGAKPAELPIEQATTFELVLNLATAKALGIAVPQSIRLRADRVIE